MDRKVFKQNIKRKSQKQFGHPLKLEAPLHGEHLHLMHFAKKEKKKETYPNMTTKTLMLSNRQQKSKKGEKLGGRLEREPNRTFCGVGL